MGRRDNDEIPQDFGEHNIAFEAFIEGAKALSEKTGEGMLSILHRQRDDIIDSDAPDNHNMLRWIQMAIDKIRGKG